MFYRYSGDYMKQRKSTEDYLKAIYVISKKNEVRGVQVAERLGLTRPTVSVSLKTLEKEGYITVDADHIIHLTPVGECLAKEMYERHLTFRSLLLDLGIDEKTADRDACEIEHAVSAKSYTAFKNLAVSLAQNQEDFNNDDK